MKKQRYAWVTIVPTAWLFITSMTAGWQKIFDARRAVGFLAQANKFAQGIENNMVIAPAKTLGDMHTIVLSNQINAILCGFFMLVAVTMLIAAIFVIRHALCSDSTITHETPPVLRNEVKHV